MTNRVTSESPADEIENTTAEVSSPEVDAKAPAESSPAEDADAKEPVKTTLDIVREVVKAKPVGESSDPEQTDDKPVTPTADTDRTDPEKPPPFHTHPAWQRQVRANTELRERVSRLEPAAEQFAAVEKFMNTNGLVPDDIVRGFTLAATIKNDPKQALDTLRGIVGNLEKQLGEVLPEDLQDAVDTGEISEDRALELSRLRAEAGHTRSALAGHIQRDQQNQQQQDAQRRHTAAAETIGSWVDAKQKSDPDFDTVSSLFNDRVRVVVGDLRAQGKTTFNPEEIRQVCDQSYKYVKAQIQQAVPRPQRVVPRAGQATSSAPSAAPSQLPQNATMLDVVRRAIQS
jgi:hypothetical protein